MAAGGEPGHVRAGLGEASSAERRPQPGMDSACCKLFLVGGQQLLDHLGQPVDVGGEPVDALQHVRQQGGVLGGEELRAFQGLFQLG